MILAAALLIGAAGLPKLADLRGESRVVLLFAASPTDPRLATQRRALADSGGNDAERDIRVVTVGGDRVTGVGDSAAALRERYRVAPDRFAALLIGKDGHVARNQTTPFAPDALFGAIDAMPMRQDEMKARRGQ